MKILMGRYYNGDIEGKFWFGVQSSDDASFFGGSECEPSYIEYFFDTDDIPDIKDGIAKCTQYLDGDDKKLNSFFTKHQEYTEKHLVELLGIQAGTEGAQEHPRHSLNEILKWYARLTLGLKILACVEKKGSCSFNADK